MKILQFFTLASFSFLIIQAYQQTCEEEIHKLSQFTRERIDEMDKKISNTIVSLYDDYARISLSSYAAMKKTEETSVEVSKMKKSMEESLIKYEQKFIDFTKRNDQKLNGNKIKADEDLKDRLKIDEGDAALLKYVKRIDDIEQSIKTYKDSVDNKLKQLALAQDTFIKNFGNQLWDAIQTEYIENELQRS